MKSIYIFSYKLRGIPICNNWRKWVALSLCFFLPHSHVWNYEMNKLINSNYQHIYVSKLESSKRNLCIHTVLYMCVFEVSVLVVDWLLLKDVNLLHSCQPFVRFYNSSSFIKHLLIWCNMSQTPSSTYLYSQIFVSFRQQLLIMVFSRICEPIFWNTSVFGFVKLHTHNFKIDKF